VSQRGDLWRWDGYAASADAKSAAAIRLEQRNRLTALDQELATAKFARAAVEQEFFGAQQRAAAAQDNTRTAQRALREAEKLLSEAQDRASRIARLAAESAGQ